jgi:hypothetical protein
MLGNCSHMKKTCTQSYLLAPSWRDGGPKSKFVERYDVVKFIVIRKAQERNLESVEGDFHPNTRCV